MTRESSRLEFLGEMAGGLAHEVKNPLSTMRLHLELMEEDFAKEESTAVRRARPRIAQLLKEVRRLEEIVHEFLRLSRGHDLKLAAVDLGRSLSDLVDLLRPEAAKAGASLHLRIRNNLGTVLLDENYFHRAMLNLAQNAIEACKPKGTGDVIIEAGRARNAIGIAVIDTGTGIPEGARERIFRPYFTTRRGGTGMGLPMARRVIEEHGGYIAFDSVEGQGTRFMVMLPVSSDESLTQIVPAGESAPAALAPEVVSATVDAVLAEAGGTNHEPDTDRA